MKKNEKIRTPLGIISVFKNEIPERYHCAAGPEILRISETHIRIRTIDQAVSWGEEVYSPRLHHWRLSGMGIKLRFQIIMG